MPVNGYIRLEERAEIGRLAKAIPSMNREDAINACQRIIAIVELTDRGHRKDNPHFNAMSRALHQ